MGLNNNKIQVQEVGDLSAGLCDNCDQLKMMNTGNDEYPSHELVCQYKKIIIEPLPPEERIINCDGYNKK